MAETLVAVGELTCAGVGFDRMIESMATLEPLARIVDAVCEDMVDAAFEQQDRMQRSPWRT